MGYHTEGLLRYIVCFPERLWQQEYFDYKEDMSSGILSYGIQIMMETTKKRKKSAEIWSLCQMAEDKQKNIVKCQPTNKVSTCHGLVFTHNLW